MLPFDNNMMIMAALILVIAATVYMFRDLEKTKAELSKFTQMFTARRVEHPAPVAKPTQPVTAEDDSTE